jgi:hypothetical protein
MERIRRLEAIFGVIAGLYGVAFTVVATAFIRATSAAPCGEPNTACVSGINSITLTFLVLVGALSLGVMLGALAHGRWQRAGALGVLLLCTVVLAMEAMLAVLSIGVLFAPAVLAAVVASLYALASLSESHLPMRRVVELAAGAASGVIGIATLVYIFFFPSIQYEGLNYGGTFSIADLYGLGRVVPALLTFGLVAFLAAGGASSNALRGSRSGQVLLLVAALALAAAAVASQFVDDSTFYLHSVGIGLLPSLALALLAVVLALVGQSGQAPEAAA